MCFMHRTACTPSRVGMPGPTVACTQHAMQCMMQDLVHDARSRIRENTTCMTQAIAAASDLQMMLIHAHYRD